MIDSVVAELIAGALLAAIGFISRRVMENRRRLALLGFSVMKRRKRVRISAAYLFRIKIDERYLLIKGGNIDQYQAIGGVYKFLPSAKTVRDNLGVERHTSFAGGSQADNDIRITLPGKNLLPFLDWFDGCTCRETSTWREFYEEMVAPGFLTLQSALRTFNPEFIGRAPTKVQYSSHMEMDELLLFDVFEVVLDEASVEEIKHFMTEDIDHRLVLVEESDIRRGCVVLGGVSKNIAGNVKWTVNNGR